MMTALRNIVLFLIRAMYMRHQMRLINSSNFSETDPTNIECTCSENVKDLICTYSSSSSDRITLNSTESTTGLPIPFIENRMFGDDPSVFIPVETTSASTPKDSTDYSFTNFHGRGGTAVGPYSSRPPESSNGDSSTSIATAKKTSIEIINRCLFDKANNSVDKLLNDAFSNFTMNYLTVIFKNFGNMVTCPISLADLMFLLSYGACFRILEAIDIAPTLPDASRYDFKAIKSFMRGHPKISTNGILIDHKIFIPNDVEVSKKFSKIGRQVFRSSLQQIDFIKSERAAKIINNWAANQTRNAITDVVTADQFNNETDLVLISVAFFNCSWLKPFDPDRTKQSVFLVDGTYRKVWTMNQEIECRYGILNKLDNSTYVELLIDTTPTCNPMKMIIILPGEDRSLPDIVPKLSEFKLEDLNVNAENNALVNISLPRFRIRTKINLEDHRQAMRINTLFSDMAIFKRITKSRYLKVSGFIEMSVIDVNEGNPHSENSTGAEISIVDPSKTLKNFHVNRPFIIFIANNDNIFAGAQVVNPLIHELI